MNVAIISLSTHLANLNAASAFVLNHTFRHESRRQTFLDRYVLVSDFDSIQHPIDYFFVLRTAINRASEANEHYAKRLNSWWWYYIDYLNTETIKF